MAENISPDVDTLRAYVRGQLSEEEAHQVSMWLGRCTDPVMPDVLFNLQDEWENELADEKLPPHLKPLSELFIKLQHDCYACIDGLIPLEPEAHPPEPVETVRLEEKIEPRVIRVSSRVEPGTRYMAVHTTDDLGRVNLLYQQELETENHSQPILVKDDYFIAPDVGRVTFWLSTATDMNALHPLPTEGADNLYSWLTGLRGCQDCQVFAHRLTPKAVEESDLRAYEQQLSGIQDGLDRYLVGRMCETGSVSDADFREVHGQLEQKVRGSCPGHLRTEVLSELDNHMSYVQDVMNAVLENPQARKELVEKKKIPYDLLK